MGYNDNREDIEEDEFEEEEEIEEYEEDEEEQMSAAERAKFELEEKLLKNKLRATFTKLIESKKPLLTATEKKDVKKAKAHPNLKGDINRINIALLANRAQVVYKAISSSPALYYVFIGILILLLIILVVAWIGSIMPWLFPDENNDGTASAQAGITGTDFYGARMIYKDEEKATTAIVEDYVEFVENGILESEQITKIEASAGGEFEVTLDINITTPADNYDYSNFNETQFMSEYSTLYNMVFDIAKVIYKIDNEVDYTGSTLIECVEGIKYFGYGDIATLVDAVDDTLISNLVVVDTNDTENKLTQADISAKVQEKLLAYYETVPTARTAKLFVKDYILSGNEMMKGIKQENYVAFIFMPKKNVELTQISFIVGNADLSNFEISIDGTDLIRSNENLGTDEKPTYLYSFIGTKNAGEYMFIDKTNLKALEKDQSLFDVLKLNNPELYLDGIEIEGTTYYTYKQGGVVVEMSNTGAFNFVEFETKWQAAS